MKPKPANPRTTHRRVWVVKRLDEGLGWLLTSGPSVEDALQQLTAVRAEAATPTGRLEAVLNHFADMSSQHYDTELVAVLHRGEMSCEHHTNGATSSATCSSKAPRPANGATM